MTPLKECLFLQNSHQFGVKRSGVDIAHARNMFCDVSDGIERGAMIAQPVIDHVATSSKAEDLLETVLSRTHRSESFGCLMDVLIQHHDLCANKFYSQIGRRPFFRNE